MYTFSTKNNKNNKKSINDYFNPDFGFGKHKATAIELLRETIKILDEFNIDYFLISGTLLGYCRHNDFIPWDDDIDIMVHSSIIDKLPEIYNKYNSHFVFINREDIIIKLCFKNKVFYVNDIYNDYMLNKGDKYNWPFIDLFIFNDVDNDIIRFFNKSWDKNKFYPIEKKQFLNMSVSIPCDPMYFLNINFGEDCMTTYKSSYYNHKLEKKNKKIVCLKINI